MIAGWLAGRPIGATHTVNSFACVHLWPVMSEMTRVSVPDNLAGGDAKPTYLRALRVNASCATVRCEIFCDTLLSPVRCGLQ